MPPEQTNELSKIDPVRTAFADPGHVARYAEGPRHFVPGIESLYRMTGVLLAERAPPDAHILVLGAGGGLELTALAQAYPGWTFTGVDPSAAMLRLAENTLGHLRSRVMLIEGLIDDAPVGPFDAAVCLLTLHFLDRDERIRTIREVHGRLRRDAPFVAAHSSFPQGEGERSQWLSRYCAYALASGSSVEMTEKARAGVEAGLRLFSPEEDAAALRAGGFGNVTQFYTAFTWCGWVGYA